jgi:acyl-CoA thioester hydrolase
MIKDHAAAPGAAHRLALRVYYEDTDFSGFVYHASYLRFLERGRTEWLRERGFSQGVMAETSLVFVVRRLEIDYRKPARMDDSLTVETRASAPGAASMRFSQTIMRDDAVIVAAEVLVAALRNGVPARMSAEIRTRLGLR